MNERPILNRLLPYVFGLTESPSSQVIFICGFRSGGGLFIFFILVAGGFVRQYFSGVNL